MQATQANHKMARHHFVSAIARLNLLCLVKTCSAMSKAGGFSPDQVVLGSSGITTQISQQTYSWRGQSKIQLHLDDTFLQIPGYMR